MWILSSYFNFSICPRRTRARSFEECAYVVAGLSDVIVRRSHGVFLVQDFPLRRTLVQPVTRLRVRIRGSEFQFGGVNGIVVVPASVRRSRGREIRADLQNRKTFLHVIRVATICVVVAPWMHLDELIKTTTSLLI